MKRFAYAALAFASISFTTFAGAQESTSNATDAVALRPIKTGDTLTYQRTPYLQPTVRGEITLSKSPGKPFDVSVVSDDGKERVLKFSNGEEVYDKTHAMIGWIDNSGARKDYDPKSVLHWMPQGELNPDMEWSSAMDWNLKGVNYGGECTDEAKYKAISSPTTRDVLINGKVVHVDAVEVTIKGRLKSVSSCSLISGEQDVLKTFVYSKALNLVLEKTSLSQSDYKEMVGGTSNRVESIIAITQN